MKHKKTAAVICVLMLVIAGIISLGCGDTLRKTQVDPSENVLLIDPGHGGMDGGASTADGILEKDINLAIAQQLRMLAESYGWQVVLTREDDRWLCETEEGSIRARKTEDLRTRKQMISEYLPDLTVSIHLNSFKEDPSVKGAQVFYPDEGGSDQVLQECRELAEIVQKNLSEIQDTENRRTAMVRDGVMIFREVISPIVIVECGFLSNPDEAQLLNTPEYQQETAEAIMAAITEFTGVDERESIEIIDSLR